MDHAGAMLLALGLDATIGWPAALFSRIGHPVSWIGALIAAADRRFNRGPARRLRGFGVAVGIIALAALAGAAAQGLAGEGWPATLLGGLLAWPLLAARSLHQHVAAVAAPLDRGDLAGARHAVSMIVGRDPATLDAPAITRAAVESLSENASDGVVAPLLWGLVLGLPGIAAYKAINTLDSMIGHRTPRHGSFGWAAARIDDLANLIPARLTGALLALVSGRPRIALAVMARDARRHRSPNAGWPEAAMAGALGVRLSGPRIYAGRQVDEPWLNGACPDPTAADLRRGLALFRRAICALAVIVAVLAVAAR